MQVKYIAGSLVLLGAIGYLITTSLQAGTLQSVPVAELRAADAGQSSRVGQRLRIVGFVGKKPLEKKPMQTPQGLIQSAEFEVVEGPHKVAVSFADALPDTFRAGGPVQVDGVYLAPGVMRAEHVLTKCPSKYEKGEEGEKKSEKDAGQLKQASASKSDAVKSDAMQPASS